MEEPTGPLWPTWPPIAEAKNGLPSLIRAHVPGAVAAFGAEDDDILKGLAAFERDRPVLDMEKDVRHDITARRRVVCKCAPCGFLARALCLALFVGAYDLSRLRLRLFTSRTRALRFASVLQTASSELEA